MILWIIIFTLGAFGVLLTILGIRGKRISDHPWCRRCRYDLFGVYPPMMSRLPDSPKDLFIAVVRCPNCGLVLSERRTVRRGFRSRRRSWITIGVFISLISIAGGGAMGILSASGISLRHYLPVWALRLDAHSSDKKHVTATLNELMSRQKTGAITMQTVAAIGLDAQGDRSAFWSPAWGDFIEQTWAIGKLTPGISEQRRNLHR